MSFATIFNNNKLKNKIKKVIKEVRRKEKLKPCKETSLTKEKILRPIFKQQQMQQMKPWTLVMLSQSTAWLALV